MAGLVPAIHDLFRRMKNVDARDTPGHDGCDYLCPRAGSRGGLRTPDPAPSGPSSRCAEPPRALSGRKGL